MIDFSKFAKFITDDSVVTAVILVDGKEVGAVSFKANTVAYKEASETIQSKPPVVSEKAKEPVAAKNVAKKSTDVNKSEVEKANNFIKKAEEKAVVNFNKQAAEVMTSGSRVEPSKPLTRDEIMSQMDKVVTELEKPSESKAEDDEEEPEDVNSHPDLFSDEW